MDIIKIKNLTFSYDKQTIIRDINLTVEKGQAIFLLGSNGCGKTTLLDCILGLNKLDNGSVLIKGNNIKDLKPLEIAKNIAYVPQSYNLTFPYKVIDVVLMGRTPYISPFSSPSKEDVYIAEESLQIVGMSKYKDRIFTNLSGGEGQLVMLARALAQKTDVIVMDEPTSHLDFKHELMILETITNLVKDRNITIIMATHYPNQVFYFENNNINTTVLMLDKGKIEVMGNAMEVLIEENIKKVFDVNSKILSYRDLNNKSLNYIVPLNTYMDDKERVV